MAPRNIITSFPSPLGAASPPLRPRAAGAISPRTKTTSWQSWRRRLEHGHLGGRLGVSVNGSGGGRRRRRRNRNRGNQGRNNANDGGNADGGNGDGRFSKQTTVAIPRQGGDRDEKPVRLQIGLNLDVDMELKAKLKGDICLSLVVERKFSKRESMRAKPNWQGDVDVEEMFHMRLGKFSFRQRWIDREVSESLTMVVGLCIAAGGFVAGFAASRWLG
ncbi:hypothetical protein Ct61P_07584 [Colletotrichum tofieldiae]|nr:hypothetical protein Ct61P_07584 [Colletotrichum tofieldiae]